MTTIGKKMNESGMSDEFTAALPAYVRDHTTEYKEGVLAQIVFLSTEGDVNTLPFVRADDLIHVYGLSPAVARRTEAEIQQSIADKDGRSVDHPPSSGNLLKVTPSPLETTGAACVSTSSEVGVGSDVTGQLSTAIPQISPPQEKEKEESSSDDSEDSSLHRPRQLSFLSLPKGSQDKDGSGEEEDDLAALADPFGEATDTTTTRHEVKGTEEEEEDDELLSEWRQSVSALEKIVKQRTMPSCIEVIHPKREEVPSTPSKGKGDEQGKKNGSGGPSKTTPSPPRIIVLADNKAEAKKAKELLISVDTNSTGEVEILICPVGESLLLPALSDGGLGDARRLHDGLCFFNAVGRLLSPPAMAVDEKTTTRDESNVKATEEKERENTAPAQSSQKDEKKKQGLADKATTSRGETAKKKEGRKEVEKKEKVKKRENGDLLLVVINYERMFRDRCRHLFDMRGLLDICFQSASNSTDLSPLKPIFLFLNTPQGVPREGLSTELKEIQDELTSVNSGGRENEMSHALSERLRGLLKAVTKSSVFLSIDGTCDPSPDLIIKASQIRTAKGLAVSLSDELRDTLPTWLVRDLEHDLCVVVDLVNLLSESDSHPAPLPPHHMELSKRAHTILSSLLDDSLFWKVRPTIAEVRDLADQACKAVSVTDSENEKGMSETVEKNEAEDKVK